MKNTRNMERKFKRRKFETKRKGLKLIFDVLCKFNQQNELPFMGSFEEYLIPESAERKHPGVKSSSLASGRPYSLM